jgi:predicted neuraminidase
VVELANGDLAAAWWSGAYEGATDAVIKVARLRPGADTWDPATTAADIPGYFQGNPVLFALSDGRLWLFFVVAYAPGPHGIQIMRQESADLGHTWTPFEPFHTERGIRTRNHPIWLPGGEILFPFHDGRDGSSLFEISGDLGRTWQRSDPIRSEPGNVQPTVIARRQNELYALMRTWHEDPAKRFLWQSASHDAGRTWDPPTYSQVPTVSSAIEMVRLRNNHVVLAYNDGRARARTPLTLALSVDGGRTWSWKRNLEEGAGAFSYPSIIQSDDGQVHATYSYRREFIKHVEVNEDWIRSRD